MLCRGRGGTSHVGIHIGCVRPWRAGCRARKREGDAATPIGRWRLRAVFYRADRLPRPRTGLPVRALRPLDGWCDAVGDRNYNRWVRHPYPASAEKLWRSDSLYDLIVILDHNACHASRATAVRFSCTSPTPATAHRRLHCPAAPAPVAPAGTLGPSKPRARACAGRKKAPGVGSPAPEHEPGSRVLEESGGLSGALAPPQSARAS
jgi:hypothetical protein